MNGQGFGKLQKEGQRGDTGGEHQEMVNKGRRRCSAEQYPGEFAKNPLFAKVSDCQQSWTQCQGEMGVTISCATESKCPRCHDCKSAVAFWRWSNEQK